MRERPSVTAKRDKNPPTRDVNAGQRVSMALDLRARKLTYEEIARRCGYANASSCRKAILRELDRCILANVDALRNEEAYSLERLEQFCWERMEDKGYEKGALFAVDRIVQIQDRRAKLLGLDRKADGLPAGATLVREYGAEVSAV